MNKVFYRYAGFLLFAFLSSGVPLFSQDLSIEAEDLRMEQRTDGGFHLFIRKKQDISSVLLTESTRDPALRADNFAYRAPEWNPINGDEIRLLNGVPIPRESRIFSLISSSPEPHPELGEAFHIFIPWIVNYGYETGRHGEVYMADGTYVNIRAFNLPYADYRGSFADNPFVLRATQKIPEKPGAEYMTEAERAFTEIAKEGRGDFVYATDPSDMVDKITMLLKKEEGKSVDIVICQDTTGSMKPYIDEVRKRLIVMLNEIIPGFSGFRIGMVLYKDYYDEYLTKLIPFTKDFGSFQRSLNAIQARGGGDIPEAVYEALYDGAEKFTWAAESRLLILIGDAPPHPRPRGKITGEMVYQKAEEKDIKISAILLPN